MKNEFENGMKPLGDIHRTHPVLNTVKLGDNFCSLSKNNVLMFVAKKTNNAVFFS